MLKDTSFEGDGLSSVDVVSSDHSDVDTSSVADSNGLNDFVSEGILKGVDTDKGKTLL